MRRQPSLRSQLNQIRLWVNQGRTDAWIAHKLDVSIDQLSRFKREQDLEPEGAAPARPASPVSVPPPAAEDDDLSDLEAPAEDEAPPKDELAEEELADEEPAEEEAPVVTADPPAWRKAWSTESREEEPPAQESGDDEPEAEEPAAEEPDDDEEEAADQETVPALDERPGPDTPGEADSAPKRRRGRRGGRRRRSGRPGSFEATFDHGEEGYGLWLDPAVTDDPVYSEHWAGHRAVTVTLSAEAITIRRAGDTDGGSED